MNGVIRFASPADHQMRITFDDLKTDEEKITEALVNGGVSIPGKSTPATEKPPSYK